MTEETVSQGSDASYEAKSYDALFGRVLAPWEGLTPFPFAIEALRQIAAELVVLRAALTNPEDGELDAEIIGRAVCGLENRARAAAEFAGRLEDDRVVARSAQRDLAVLEGAAVQQQGGAS
jgi:hypothetical protein